MNTNPKTFVAVKWSDLKTSKELTDYIEDQAQDVLEDSPYFTKAWLADTLEIIRDTSDDPAFPPGYASRLITELANVAKVVKAKGIEIIIL